MAQEMGSASEEDFDGPGTRHRGLFVRNLDEESCRHVNLLSIRVAAVSSLWRRRLSRVACAAIKGRIQSTNTLLTSCLFSGFGEGADFSNQIS
jgi:hypothetical protein